MSTTVSRNEIFLSPSILHLGNFKNIMNLYQFTKHSYISYSICLIWGLHTNEILITPIMIAKLRIWEYCKMFTDDGALYLHSNRIHPHIYLLLCFCLHRRTKTNPSKPRSETSMISILKYIRRQRIWRSWGKVSEWQISLLEATYLMIFGWDASIKNCELLQHLPMTHPYCHQSCPCKLGRFKANW